MATTVTAFADMDPSPRVELDIDPADLPVGTITVQVWRTSKWGAVDVRQARRLLAGGLVVTDYEPPVGVEVTYSLEGIDTNGDSLGMSAFTATIQVDLTIPWVILSDPFAPSRALLLRAERGFVPTLSKERAVQTYRAGLSTIALAGLRSKFQDLALRVFTETEAEREALDEMLEDSAILQVRAMPGMRLPGELFIVVPGRQVMRHLDATLGGDLDEWTLPGEQITRPILDVLLTVENYDLYEAYLDALDPPNEGTYDDAEATWTTYLDAMRNPPT